MTLWKNNLQTKNAALQQKSTGEMKFEASAKFNLWKRWLKRTKKIKFLHRKYLSKAVNPLASLAWWKACSHFSTHRRKIVHLLWILYRHARRVAFRLLFLMLESGRKELSWKYFWNVYKFLNNFSIKKFFLVFSRTRNLVGDVIRLILAVDKNKVCICQKV